MWIYLTKNLSDSISSAASAESRSPSVRGCNQPPIVNATSIVNRSSSPEWPTDRCRKHRSGMMSRLSTEDNSKASSISSTGDSLARIFRQPEGEQAWKASGADFFLRSCAWPKKSSPVSYSLKMSRPSGRADSMLSSTNWPISGMTVGGTIYPLTTWAHRTSEKDGSSLPTKKDPTPMGLWPTPTAELTGRTVEQYQEYIEKDRNGRTKPCHLEISVQMWPTPCALDYITPKTDVALNRMMTEIRPGRNGAEPEGRPKTSGLRRSAEDENGMVGEEHGRQSQSGLGGMADGIPDRLDAVFNPEWWRQEPNIPRVTQEKERRVQRLRALGNAVVPAQAREAFRRLAGL